MNPDRGFSPRLRSLTATLVGFVLVGVAVVFPGGRPAVAMPVAPSLDPPPIVGFIGDIPTSIPITIPAGMTIGGTALLTGGSTAASGAVATCAAGSAGVCLAIGGAMVGTFALSYNVTYKLLELTCGPLSTIITCGTTELADIIPGVASAGWRPCAGSALASMIAAAETVPGAACGFFSVGQSLAGGANWSWELYPDGAVGGSKVLSFSGVGGSGSGRAFTTTSTGSVLEATIASTMFRYPAERVGSFAQATSVAITRPLSELYVGDCAGYIACNVNTDAIIAVRLGNTSGNNGTIVATAPVDTRVAYNGQQRRMKSTGECTTIGTSGFRVPDPSYTVWFFDREWKAKKMPAILPRCYPTEIMTRIKIEVQTAGKVGLTTVLDVHLPSTEFDIATALRDCMIRTNDETQCKPGRVGTGPCKLGGVIVADRYCDRQTELEEVEPVVQPRPSTVGSPAATPGSVSSPPQVQPPEPVTETGTTPESPSTGVFGPPTGAGDSECFPSGWGLLNPVDWVLKPVKCALKWAFFPTTAISTRLTAVRTEADDSAVGTITDAAGEFAGAGGDTLSAAGASSNCLGPPIKFDPDAAPSYPFSSCSEPMQSVAAWFRALLQAAIALVGFVTIYNTIVRPFGIEPLWSQKQSEEG